MKISHLPGDTCSVISMAADQHGLAANSHLIVGSTQCVLIDAQFLPTSASNVADEIERCGRRLTYIYITHAHPDHYFGSMVLRARFPQARVVAVADVVSDIAATWQAKRAFWLSRYAGELPTAIELPEVLLERHLMIDAERIEIVELGPAEGLHDTVCYMPGLNALFAGDLAYNAEHAWMGDQTTDAWLRQLDSLQQRFGNASHVLPGHGSNAGAELIAQTATYLRTFAAAAKHNDQVATAVATVLAAYPSYQLPLFVQLSMEKWFAPKP
jgi:glyoxylase-like metal-dependent hydrolase (beta-lactamase superfamily II)